MAAAKFHNSAEKIGRAYMEAVSWWNFMFCARGKKLWLFLVSTFFCYLAETDILKAFDVLAILCSVTLSRSG